ncbi:MAG: RusA family crossover junction endodeoxyribonuclease [Planctomycetes bacterium]|nr:RusA family crossover junction endodeoxyribonuclease [Planctomycetota bacterium]
MSSQRPEKPHPRSAISARMSAAQFRALMGRSIGKLARRVTRADAAGAAKRNGTQQPESAFEVVLPFLPPSINATYATVFDRETGRMKRVLSTKARRAKTAIQTFVRGSLQPDGIYELHIDVELPAITKGGNPRKVDLSNRIKFLEDCVAKALGIDDSRFFRIVLTKLHAEHERTVIRILPMSESAKDAA